MHAFYQQFMAPGDLVFDVGANVGTRSQVFLDLGCRVVAVEPDPRCIGDLKKIPDLSVVHAAAGKDGEFGNLKFGHTSNCSSLSGKWINAVTQTDRFSGYQWTAELPVIQVSLDHLILLHGCPQFIKIDVEGYEEEVLNSLSQSVPALSFEFHPEFLVSTAECLGRLQDLGMPEFSYSLEETFELSPWMSGQEVINELRTFEEDNHVYGDIYARRG